MYKGCIQDTEGKREKLAKVHPGTKSLQDELAFMKEKFKSLEADLAKKDEAIKKLSKDVTNLSLDNQMLQADLDDRLAKINN